MGYVLCLWFQNNKGVKEDITTVFLHMHYIAVWTQSGTAARVPVFFGKAPALPLFHQHRLKGIVHPKM